MTSGPRGAHMSFATQPTEILVQVRRNLLDGLDLVAAHIAAGTFHDIPPGKASPPSESGQLTLMLLTGIDAELARRKAPR